MRIFKTGVSSGIGMRSIDVTLPAVGTTVSTTQVQTNSNEYYPTRLFELYFLASVGSGTFDTALTRLVVIRGNSTGHAEYFTLAQMGARQQKLMVTDADSIYFEHKTTTGTGVLRISAIMKEVV